MRRFVVAMLMLFSVAAQSAEITDATGRTITVPDRITRVVPAGPGASLLLLAIAPEKMAGFPFPVSPERRAWINENAAALPQVPRVTGRDDVSGKLREMGADLIIDYGAVTPRYIELAKATQERTGIPTLLIDVALENTPQTIRQLGKLLGNEARAEAQARFAESLLSTEKTGGKRVVFARGTDGLSLPARNTDLTHVFDLLGWKHIGPDAGGTVSLAEIAALDPDVIVFGHAHMREVIAQSPEWRALRAVREGRGLIAPSMPWPWFDEPPSVNRLLGLAWLAGRDPLATAEEFHATFYGRALSPAQREALAEAVRPAR